MKMYSLHWIKKQISFKNFNSIKHKVICLDLLLVIPLFLIFCMIFIYILEDNNYKLNYSKLDALEEKCANIENRNTEIVKITNAFYLDTQINQIISKKKKWQGYEKIKAENAIQAKILELTEIFPSYQYQLMVLCENGLSVFQTSLNNADNKITLNDLKQESWYQDVKESENIIYFLPKYRSPILDVNFKDDVFFAVRSLRNINSGRDVGLMLVVISADILETADKAEERILVMDQYRKIIYSSDADLYGVNIADNDYYKRIIEYSKGFFLGNVKNEYSHIRFVTIDNLGWKMIAYEPYTGIWSYSYMVVWMAILGILLAVVLVVIVFYNCNLISARMKKLNENILEVTEGNLKARISDTYEIEFQEICANFNNMLNYIETLMRRLEEEEQEKHQLEIQALQAQINPHFFYNTLTTIRFMIQMEEYAQADRAMLAFSKLLRKSFAKPQGIITIEEELSMAEEYLELMSIRYRDKFVWKITIMEKVKNLGILKNVIQPLLENSISHGFNMKKEMGHIRILVYQKDTAVMVEIEDDGVEADIQKIQDSIQNKEKEQKKYQMNGIGINNIQMRILRNFGEGYGLSAMLNEVGGVTFTMRIPVITMEKERI